MAKWLNLTKLLNNELEGPVEQMAIAAQSAEFDVAEVHLVCEKDLLQCRQIFTEQAQELGFTSIKNDENGNVVINSTLFVFLTPLAYEHCKVNITDESVFFINLI